MKQSAGKTRIMVFGTFDVIHQGHEHMLTQARCLADNPYLIVSVARDKNVIRIKGDDPLMAEKKRLAAIRALPQVDNAVLGAVGDHIPHIVQKRPDIIALGYDQIEYIDGLAGALKKNGLRVKIVRLRPHMPHKYKSSLIKRTLIAKI